MAVIATLRDLDAHDPRDTAVIAADAPARGALVAMCLERAVPCVAPLPWGATPSDDDDLVRRARGATSRVGAWSPSLADPGVSRMTELVARGHAGAVRSVHVSLSGPVTTARVAEALCIARSLRGVAVSWQVHRDGDALRASGDGVTVDVGARVDGVEVTLDGTQLTAALVRTSQGATLTLRRGDDVRATSVPSPTAPRGALYDLTTIAESMKTARAWCDTASSISPPSTSQASVWREASSRARGAHDALAAAGLVSDVALDDAAVERDPIPRELPRLEALAFEAGIKPALYLTVPRDELPALLARYAGCAIARIDYVCEHDGVLDVRRRANVADGEGTHADLFIARDPRVAARAKEIYATPRGPTEHVAEMGSLLGYPPCCVAAFAALADRSNNTAVRYEAIARTASLGVAFAPELNNLFAHVLPFYPCTYGCPRAVSHARAVLDALGNTAAPLRERLARPVFYVDHARQVSLGGARVEGDVLRYARVYGGMVPRDESTEDVTSRFEAAMAGALTLGDGLRVDAHRVTVLRGDRAVVTLTRASPGLGVLAPFGVS